MTAHQHNAGISGHPGGSTPGEPAGYPREWQGICCKTLPQSVGKSRSRENLPGNLPICKWSSAKMVRLSLQPWVPWSARGTPHPTAGRTGEDSCTSTWLWVIYAGRFFLMNAGELSPVDTIESFFPRRKRKIQKNAQFLFCGKRKAFSKENWLQWLRPSVLHGRALVLFWNATKTAKFIKNFQVHISHNGQINYTFKRELAYLSKFYRCFIHFDL